MDIIKLIPQDQINRVLNQEYCDIDMEFMGFLDIYESLSKIIPKHFTVIDLGCAYNAQCFYFADHARLVSVDLPLPTEQGKMERFTTSNCTIYETTIARFIESHLQEFDQDETFAICSYVPDWYGNNMELVRHSFKNAFTYYPHETMKVRIGKGVRQ